VNITAWSTVSPYGLGRAAFTAGLLARRPTAVALDPGQWQVPDARACLVPQFDPRTTLGLKGTRTMNRVTGLAVTAVGDLAQDLGAPAGPIDDPMDPAADGIMPGSMAGSMPRTALVLGTTTGSVQSMMDFTRSSLTGERPFDVEPAAIPNSVMNCAAAQCAIWHHIQGPNTTLACGRPSGLLALAYARRLLLGGRAETVLCGGAEEYSPARSWLEHHSRDGEPALLGEGAAILRVEFTDGPDTLATVLAVESRVCLPTSSGTGRASRAVTYTLGAAATATLTATAPAPANTRPTSANRTALAETDVAATVAEAVRRALGRAGVAPRNVWAAVPSGHSEGESAALRELFGTAALERVPATGDLLGDTGAASAAFQLTATLAAGADESGRVAVITSVDPGGAVAAAVLRLGDGAFRGTPR